MMATRMTRPASARPHLATLRLATLRLAALRWTVLLCGALFAGNVTADVPDTVLIQGALLTKAGGPTTDGLYDLTFAIYADKTGGAALWSESAKLAIQGGEFSHVLGSVKALPDVFATLKQAWIGAKVGSEPELPRKQLHAVTFARRAAVAEAAAFPYAGSKTKGGPANDLQCTGCVGLSELKIDGDLDLGGNALKAKKVSAAEVAATTVTATAFVGDGSKLTGIVIPSGSCKDKGTVVKGIKPDGSLECVAAMDPDGLPPDGLDEISNGLLTNQFVDEMAGKVLPIQDNNPTGVNDSFDFPDVGLAQELDVLVSLTNSDISKVTVWLFDPNNVKYVLYDKGASGTKLSGTWPSKTKTVSGDLTTWIGKNPKGKWRLQVIDVGFKDNQIDGQVDSWSLRLKTLSSKKVSAAGKLIATGGFQLPTAAAEPAVCDAANLGYMWVDSKTKALKICNGKKWFPINLVTPDGSKDNPAKSCSAIKDVYPELKTGAYWLDPDGAQGAAAPYEAWCEMDLQAGGWTLAMHVHPADGSVVSFTNTKFWLDDAIYGSFANHFTKDYKGPAAWTIGATAIMVQVTEPGDAGKVIGWKAWSMGARTFDSFFHSPANTTQTASVLGSDVSKVYAYEAVIRNGTHLQSNRAINPNSDRVRLGVNGYSAQGDDNQPGLGTQMNEGACGVGNNCYRYKDVELWVNSGSNLWCTKPGNGSYKWIGSDGGCGGSCGSCDSTASPPYSPYWTYRIYVR